MASAFPSGRRLNRKIYFGAGTNNIEVLIWTMRPSLIQQLAMQAKLNMHMGAEAFDRIFMGAEFTHAWQGVLYVKVRSEYSAHQLKKEHVNLLAAVAQDILGERIAFVDVISRGAARFTI